jgi:MFS family permease
MVFLKELSLTHKLPSMANGLFVWAFGAIFYLLGFFHRVAPAVITNELMRDFQMNAAALGNLSAFYFYSYVAMQIPTGILADRWGPRRLLTAGACVTAVGSAMFAMAPSTTWAATGRLLIGGSVAVAFVGLLKVASNWFSPRRFALVSGLALTVGIVGAVFAGTPLRILVDNFGWRAVILSSAVVSIIIGAGTWFFVRDFPHEKGFTDFSETPFSSNKGKHQGLFSGVRQVFQYTNTTLLFLIPGGVAGCVLTFAGLWGVPFLVVSQRVTPETAATLTSVLLVAWAIGGPFFGWLSDRLGNRKKLFILGCGVSVAGWVAVVFLNFIPLLFYVPVLILTGFFSGNMMICFVFSKESVPVRLSGTVSGVINMGVMSGPMILQPAVGWVLDKLWTGEMVEGVRVYSLAAYRGGFSLMLAWILFSFILLFFTRETNCEQLIR